jgi:hypothetical protein
LGLFLGTTVSLLFQISIVGLVIYQIRTNPPIAEMFKNNPLTASAADALSSESPSPSVFRRIINAIESPFVWLFVKLGF